MRYGSFLGLALALVSTGACGDDDPGGSSATSAAGGGGSGGSTTQTTTATSTTASTTTSTTSTSTGMGGSGGAGGAGGAGGSGGAGGAGGSSSSGMSRGNDGDPCSVDSDCLSGACFTEADGYPGGTCTGECEPAGAPCPGGGTCSGGLCYGPCSADRDCRDVYSCQTAPGGESICLPACESDRECPDAGACDALSGYCFEPIEPEECHDGKDNDKDFLFDCEDDECLVDPRCSSAIQAACEAALTAGPSNEGDTTGGTNLFGSFCGGSAALEQVFTYTPSVDGMMRLTLTSASDQGIFVRGACDDFLSELDCIDRVPGGQDEILELPVRAGVPLAIVVDGFESGEEGPFSLTVSVE